MDDDDFTDHHPDESIEETKQKVHEMMKDFMKQNEGKDIKIDFDDTEYSDYENTVEPDSDSDMSYNNEDW